MHSLGGMIRRRVRTFKLLIPPPIVALITALAMWGAGYLLPAFRLQFPFQTILSVSLIVIGIALDLISILAFRTAKTTVTPIAPQKASSLVVHGLYRFTRNPMYLGLLLILSGIAVLIGSTLNLITFAAFIAYITAFQIRPEEESLQEIFGPDYTRYCDRVRRWI